MAKWQGWNVTTERDGEGNVNINAPGVFKPDGTFQWADGSGRIEETVLVQESDPSGGAFVDSQGIRVPKSVAEANNLTIRMENGAPQVVKADPDFDANGGFLDKFIGENPLAAMATMAKGFLSPRSPFPICCKYCVKFVNFGTSFLNI